MKSNTALRGCRGRRRGVGSLVAALFIIFLIVSALGVLLATYREIDSYQRSVHAMDRLDWERSQENIVILSSGSQRTEAGRFKLAVENQGYLEASLVWLGVFNKSTGRAVYPYESIPDIPDNTDYNPRPGETVYVWSNQEHAYPDQDYVIHVVTKRGNIATITYEDGTFGTPSPVAEVAQEVGPVFMQFTSLQHASLGSGNVDLEDFSPGDLTWEEGWVITAGEDNVVWRVTVVNYFSKEITLNNVSIFSLRPVEGGAVVNWWIINVGADGNFTYYSNADAVVIPANSETEVTLYFGASSRNGLNTVKMGSKDLYTNYITLSGEYSDGGHYSQTLLPLQGVDAV
ncbi:MAG: hypothetical protein ACE5GD_04790 [Candidatus Geothermarchaeales archaeon]